ncbi:class III extradiol dioxygenase subunit B-like domain-containing protein [Streptomyces sp. N2-109]|uniref:Class III extradiol dioxygenase subunit B-like domain-containing protein n=1 Tax=Streptomyces gossypii TaxID=2883101 RepID=A0ABT2JRU6_9ACTN|nr:class III extradiol dioxygenase subunit B-like domain-containing protein [Streptomyces gossypii]MCT2590587.1 class III extradiol dioxygenase subunit B-like domain-containing protein [Streptomyces gossypii]
MLVAAAVCPCPPLLVPEVAGGAAHEMDDARAACFDAIGVLTAARVDRLVVVGPADQPGRGPHPQGAGGSFRGFGTDLQVTLGPGPAKGPAGPGTGGSPAPGGGVRELPPSLAVGAWLLARTGWNFAPVEGLGVGELLARERCAATGREVAQSAPRVALLVMGDGSACRTLKAPGYFDERAAAFDAAAGTALGAADLAGLLALDEELAYELKAAGRASWQVLAGAAEGAGLSGRLLYDAAPYGVGYMVASWA